MQKNPWMSIAEAASELGVSRQRVHLLVATGKLAAERVGAKIWVVRRTAVQARAKARKGAAS